MPLFTEFHIYGLNLYIEFHIGVDETEYIINEVILADSNINILDILSEEVIIKIENHIGENLDDIISYNDDGGVY